MVSLPRVALLCRGRIQGSALIFRSDLGFSPGMLALLLPQSRNEHRSACPVPDSSTGRPVLWGRALPVLFSMSTSIWQSENTCT